jgi:tRNA(Ile)-lysidine synthetase, N-terminal domain/tRNA(Ile)-lysidine synthetase, C-terminal domain
MSFQSERSSEGEQNPGSIASPKSSFQWLGRNRHDQGGYVFRMTSGDATTPIRAAVRDAIAPHDRVVLAVSGGVDSMVLLDAAVAVARVPLLVATFDHGTGNAASQAVELVRRRSAELGVQCVSGRSAAPLCTEEDLRGARWRFLRDAATGFGAAAVVATAHTEDDQLETVLLRVMRGAGARGLAGLYARGRAVRPLIGVRRCSIETYAAEKTLFWANDPSNESPRFARNRVRHDILPALRRASPSIDADLLRISREAARWRSEVDSYVDSAISVRVLDGGRGLDVNAAAIEVQSVSALAVLWPAIAARAGVRLDHRGIARLAAFTGNARVGQRVQLSGDWEVVRSRDAFQLRASAKMGLPAQAIPRVGGQWGDWVFRPSLTDGREDAWSAWLPVGGQALVREWQAGDSMTSSTGGHPTLVKRLLSKAGVTGYDRDHWPVVVVNDQIVWIPGVRRSDAATARSGRPGLLFVCEYHSS